MTDFDPQHVRRPGTPSGLAVASLVLGVISLVLACVWYLSIPCALLAVILGSAGRSAARLGAGGGGMATAGIVCGSIALTLYALLLLMMLTCGIAVVSTMPFIAEAARETGAG